MSAVTTAALAASTVTRPGIAASVVRIMPVLYSVLTASTATMATAAWPRSTPVRLILPGSWPQPAAGHRADAAAAALTATVTATTASSSQAVPGEVRSLVHSARSAALTRPSGAAGTRATARAAAAQAQSTANPAQGASG